MSITVLNTDAGLSAKTIVNAEDGQTVTGLKTFDRDPSAPFAVSASSAVVTNLDADSVDGAHYTVGTWTPVIGGAGGTSGQAYSGQTATYVKIGKLVWVGAEVVLSTKGTITGSVEIQGLPFAVGATSGDRGVFSVLWNSTANNFVSMVGVTNAGGTTATLYGIGAAANALATLATADIANTTGFAISGCYRAAS